MTRGVTVGLGTRIAGVLLLATRLAVICIGGDPAATGDAQASLERKLATPEVTIVGAAEIASFLALEAEAPPERVPSAGALEEEGRLLSQAKQAYWDGDAPQVLSRVGSLAALAEKNGTLDDARRAQLALLRAAAFLVSKDERRAREEAEEALWLDPALAVDLRTYRPSVAELVESARQTVPVTHVLTVTNIPLAARVAVDGRAVEKDRVVLLPGKHRIVVTAPGRGRVARIVEVSADTSIGANLPLRLDAAMEAVIGRVVVQGHAQEAKEILSPLAKKLAADRVLLVVLRAGGARAALWDAKSETLSPAEPRIAEWTRARLAPGTQTGPRPRLYVAASTGARAPKGSRYGARPDEGPFFALSAGLRVSPSLAVETEASHGSGGDEPDDSLAAFTAQARFTPGPWPVRPLLAVGYSPWARLEARPAARASTLDFAAGAEWVARRFRICAEIRHRTIRFGTPLDLDPTRAEHGDDLALLGRASCDF